MNFSTSLLLAAAIASLVPSSCATNLLRKLSLNDGDLSAPNQPAVSDSHVIGEMGAISQDSALSTRLDTSVRGFLRTYPQESLPVSTTSLTGYMMIATYDDAACTKLQVAVASILNTCTKSTDGYMKLTATASDSFITYYSDKECTKVTSTDLPATYPTGCTGSTLTYVSSNGIPALPYAIVGISRYVVGIITFPYHSHQSLSCCFLQLLMKLHVKSYGNNLTRLKDLPTRLFLLQR